MIEKGHYQLFNFMVLFFLESNELSKTHLIQHISFHHYHFENQRCFKFFPVNAISLKKTSLKYKFAKLYSTDIPHVLRYSISCSAQYLFLSLDLALKCGSGILMLQVQLQLILQLPLLSSLNHITSLHHIRDAIVILTLYIFKLEAESIVKYH